MELKWITKPENNGHYLMRYEPKYKQFCVSHVIVESRGKGKSVLCPWYNDRAPLRELIEEGAPLFASICYPGTKKQSADIRKQLKKIDRRYQFHDLQLIELT